jgi:hypothetical protein
MAGGEKQPGDLNIGLIAVGGVLLFAEMLGIAGFYSAVSGGELIFLQAIASAALMIVPVIGGFVIWRDMKKKQKK